MFADEEMACAFPMGATGEQGAVDYLSGLAGFDHGEMTEAMRSTDNRIFPVWQRRPRHAEG